MTEGINFVMSFKITKIHGTDTRIIETSLIEFLGRSRFTARVESFPRKMTIRDVRLKNAKDYCGNHPFACIADRPHRKFKYLEGADWVAFNDMVNDVLDKLNVSANVESSVCVIRIGAERCIEYSGKSDGFHPEWTKKGIYKNCIGTNVRARYPEGTPGNDKWKMEA